MRTDKIEVAMEHPRQNIIQKTAEGRFEADFSVKLKKIYTQESRQGTSLYSAIIYLQELTIKTPQG